ncbi:MAG: hypothetical protein SPI53_03490, partial [Erysipelotrichaceae bacterium]|nr:hypothetical protein [Erysipelotrichaceae bacterium]
MNKLKNLISNLSKKHIIIITLSLVMVVAVVLGIYLTTTKPLLVFKENIIFEYGSKASDIKLDDLVIKEKSKYEKIEVIKDNKIDTMKIGKASIK